MKRLVLLCAVLACGVFTNWAQSPPVLLVDVSTDSQVRLSWTNTATGFVLEQVDQLPAAGQWSPVLQAPQLIGQRLSVVLSSSTRVRFFRLATRADSLPPDPAAIAPPLSKGTATDLGTATSFLYTGANPIQTGVATGTFDARRVSVLRGKVKERNDSPLAGVTVTILEHPEFGQTKTRADGMFDLAVNGGGVLIARYEKPGYCPAQRPITATWQEYVCLPEVVLMTMDPVVTPVMMGTNSPMQLVRGSVQSDLDGPRRATLILPAGTCADLIVNGAPQACRSLNIRATEFTVGRTGPESMPGQLPANSAYTYCVELSADEAGVAGATAVQFNQPVCFYLENFLNFPVGQAVPMGYYDRQKGVWVASQNGRVIKVLNLSAGLAVLDTDGNGVADSAAQLAALGVTDAERQRLASLYSAGQTLWRTCITHFSPWDCNWPWLPPKGAKSADQSTSDPKPPDNPCQIPGSSVIKAESQAFAEDLNVVGTPYHLHYESDRVRGNKAAYTLHIPLSEATPPASLKRITLIVEVAGRVFPQEFSAAANQSTSFTWDGNDAYGRFVTGKNPIRVRVGYVYDAVYTPPGEFDQAFGAFSGETISASSARGEITLWKDWDGLIGNLPSEGVGLGGWTLNVHHAYDPRGKGLYLGDGRRRTAAGLDTTVINTFAGGGIVPGNSIGDGGPASAAEVSVPSDIAVGPDGSIYIAEPLGERIRRVTPDGTISTFAGSSNAVQCFPSTAACGDGGPATQALLNDPEGVAVAPDGTMYIADRSDNRIRKVDLNGIITTVAGTGVDGFGGDGGPATLAQLSSPSGVAVGPDGSLFIADTSNRRIRKVSTTGIITSVVNGGFGSSGDGGPAVLAKLNQPWRVTATPDGSLYIVDRGDGRIRRVSADGIINTVAGAGGGNGFGGDGGPALLAKFSSPEDVAVAPDGSFYIADKSNFRVRFVGTEGIITTVAGTGDKTFNAEGDAGPATRAKLGGPEGLALGQDGSLYIGDYIRVRRVRSALPGFSATDVLISADDGAEVYVFNNGGRHLRTVDALTRAVRYQFIYDLEGQLTSITDGDTNVTTIERDASAHPTALVGPYGQRTALTVDANRYLTTLKNPANEQTTLGYTVDGLLTSLTNPRAHRWIITYDNLGRLTNDIDPAGGFKTLTRGETANSLTVAVSTALQRTNRYEVINLSNGDRKRIHTAPTGLQTELLEHTDGTSTTRAPNGVEETAALGPDPRWGMLAPIVQAITTRLPSGLTNSVTTQRAATLANPIDPFSVINTTETTSVNGRNYVSKFTAAIRTTTNSTPVGRKVVTTYDTLMRPTQEQIADFHPSRYTYDARGRLITVIQGSGTEARTNRFAYNAAGYLTGFTDSLGRSRTLSYDAAGRILNQTLPDNRVIRTAYDANGNLASLTPPGRPAHTFSYSPVDLRILYAPPTVAPGTNSTAYSYNLDRELAVVTRPDLRSIQYDYSANGCNCDRLDSLIQDRGTNNYTYDSLTGNLTAINAPGGINLTFAYDGRLLTTETWSGPVAGSVTYAYDNDFRVTDEFINGGASIAYQYDPDSLLTRAGALTLTRSATNGLIARTALGGVTNVWSFNGFGEITGSSAAFNATTLYAVRFTRDHAGRISQKTETIGGVTDQYTYSYDAGDRLVTVLKNGAAGATYTYDSNGNRLSFTGPGGTANGAYDNQDRLTQYGATTYAYTANGELKTKTAGASVTSYQYDALGSLLNVTLPGGTTIDYLIDAKERRFGKKVNGALVQAFLYQGQLRPVAEMDGAGNVVSRFVYATGVNVPDYMIKGGVTYRIVADQLGSPRLVVDIATGAVAQRIDYGEFGQVLNDTNPGFQPFGFAGGRYDRETKLVRFGARDYDPEAGRWTAKDPILFAEGEPNLYEYVRSDPVNFTDSDGLKPKKAEQKKGGWKSITIPPVPKNKEPLDGCPGDIIHDDDGNITTYNTDGSRTLTRPDGSSLNYWPVMLEFGEAVNTTPK